MKQLIALFFILFLFSTPVFSQDSTVMGKNNPLNILEAIDISISYAKQCGYKASDYEIQSAELMKNGEWYIFFKGKPKDGLTRVGYHFSITIDKYDKSKIKLSVGK